MHATVRAEDVFCWLDEFCSRYFRQRDAEATLALLSPRFLSVGTGEGEVALDKAQFRHLLLEELQALPWPMSCVIENFTAHRRAETCWDCFCDLLVGLEQPERHVHVTYRIRLTAGFHVEDERWFIDTMHASEASHTQEDGEFFPLSFVFQGTGQINRKTQRELTEILVQLMPGGIVGGYVEEGFPLYVANDRMLQMAGYSSYEEFDRAIQGLVINSIHPDDRDFVTMLVHQALTKGDQYEVQYRMKRRDGSDMWVHDIGRKTIADNGREAIISVLVDISEQVSAKKDLEKAADKDPLTGLFNRKAAQTRIETAMHTSGGYLFVIMDLDNFKQVNDRYGHQQGDRALYEFAGLLTHTFRRTDTLFRLGGDEFGVLFSAPREIGVLEYKLKSLVQNYQALAQKSWPRACSSLSIGGVYGQMPREFAELYRMADKVLYEVKKEGKGSVRILPL